MTISYFSYIKTEQKNSIRSTIYAILVHLLLLLLIFFFQFEITPPEDPDAPPYLSLVSFIPVEKIKQYDDAGGSKGAEGLETKEGGSEGNAEASPTPEPEPVAESKVESKPVEAIPAPSGPKPVVTSSEPDVVTLPSPPKIPPVSSPTSTSGSTGSPTVPSTPTSTTTHSSSGDDDSPGTGGSGTGTGTGQGSGDASSGSGTGAGGGSGTGGGGGTGGGEGAGTGGGTGDGVGVNFDEVGELRRRREFCSINPNTLAGPVMQSAVFNICIDRQGNITYATFNSKKSLTRDIKFVRAANAQIRSCKYFANPSAPRKECGTVTIKIAGMEKRLK